MVYFPSIIASCQVRSNQEQSCPMLHAAQIRAARALLGWRQEQLAKASGVGTATIQRIEKSVGPVGGYVSTLMLIRVDTYPPTGPTLFSIRWIVAVPTPDALANCSWRQPKRARAARICAA